MKIHEYQGKELFRKFGLVTPSGFPCFSVDEAVEAAKKLGGSVWVVKAQIHAGGRGKGGGVKVAKSLPEVKQHAEKILGMQLVTHQTGPGGQKVRRLLVEEGADIRKELYVGMVVDRVTQRACLMASSEGGMDIEEVAAHTPEKIYKVFIDPATGLRDAEAADVAKKIGVPDNAVAEAAKLLQNLYKCFDETDASLAEINPLILTQQDKIVALDSKLNFDDNALFRHPDIVAMRDLDEEDPLEIEASKYDLSYTGLFAQEMTALYDQWAAGILGTAYALCTNMDGYMPAHLSKASQPVTGNHEIDLIYSRDRRKMTDAGALCANQSTAAFLFQTYVRDTGEVLSDLGMPILLQGRRWGTLRVGFTPTSVLD